MDRYSYKRPLGHSRVKSDFTRLLSAAACSSVHYQLHFVLQGAVYIGIRFRRRHFGHREDRSDVGGAPSLGSLQQRWSYFQFHQGFRNDAVATSVTQLQAGTRAKYSCLRKVVPAT